MVTPFVNKVVIPIVRDVVIPLAHDYIKAYNEIGDDLNHLGSQIYDNYQSFTRTVHDDYQSFYHSVNDDLQGLEHDVTHIQLTDLHRLLVGALECAALAVVASLAVELLPEAAISAGAIDLAIYGTAAIGLGGRGYLEFGHWMYEAGSYMVDLAVGCASNTVGAFSIS